MKHYMLRVSAQELATILAALRYHQAENLSAKGQGIADACIRAIASDGGRLKPLSAWQVDRLCRRLNRPQRGG